MTEAAKTTALLQWGTATLGHPPVLPATLYDRLVGLCRGPIQAIRQGFIPLA